MHELVIYHNPKCSKSRSTLEILQKRGLKPLVVDYLKNPLNITQLKELSSHFPLNEFVRTDEAIFQELNLSLNHKSEVLKAMSNYPILMQRPIVIYKGKAIIGRPPENVIKILKV